jgi:glycosyltransferase involved in cell wall biosynthesis
MFGESYQLYACLDALWLPPLTEQCSEDLARTQLALAYAIARPLLLPRSVTAYPAPYQFQYDPPDDTLNAILSFSRGGMDPALLDTYLQQWTPEASLQQLLRYANAVTQETVTTRPDFGVHPAPVSAAHPWRPANVLQTAPLKCALAVESLDKGGLEEMVGQLARHLRSQGAEPFVICVQRGGMVADRLQADGIPVHIADGQRMILRDVLQKEQPAVINTQWAGKALLEVASDLGIPIVETIQNTYVWLTQEGWQSERQRSLYYSHALAVSELVKRYYLKWNPAYNAEWISIAPNGIDPSRLAEYPRTDARQELDISTHEYLFLSLASYDRRKNHLGLLSAFDQLARDYPQARLLCAGNPLDPHYYDQVSEYRDSLKSKERIHFTDFRADPGLLLSAADSFVINSFFEGWSLAATEALMAGLPLIHSECGSAHELVGMAGERGIVVPNPAAAPLSLTLELTLSIAYQHQQRNIPALIQAMAQMIEQRQDWFEKREAIRAYARQHFSLDHILEEYLRVLYRLAGLTPGTQLSQKGN